MNEKQQKVAKKIKKILNKEADIFCIKCEDGNTLGGGWICDDCKKEDDYSTRINKC